MEHASRRSLPRRLAAGARAVGCGCKHRTHAPARSFLTRSLPELPRSRARIGAASLERLGAVRFEPSAPAPPQQEKTIRNPGVPDDAGSPGVANSRSSARSISHRHGAPGCHRRRTAPADAGPRAGCHTDIARLCATLLCDGPSAAVRRSRCRSMAALGCDSLRSARSRCATEKFPWLPVTLLFEHQSSPIVARSTLSKPITRERRGSTIARAGVRRRPARPGSSTSRRWSERRVLPGELAGRAVGLRSEAAALERGPADRRLPAPARRLASSLVRPARPRLRSSTRILRVSPREREFMDPHCGSSSKWRGRARRRGCAAPPRSRTGVVAA